MLYHMHEFCRAREWTYRAYDSPRKPGVWEYAVWYFANLIHAHMFRRQFGGERITVTEKFRGDERYRG
jgi:hypothetical protein